MIVVSEASPLHGQHRGSSTRTRSKAAEQTLDPSSSSYNNTILEAVVEAAVS